MKFSERSISTRRQFLTAGAAAAAVAVNTGCERIYAQQNEAQKESSNDAPNSEAKTSVKFSVFADIHHLPAQFFSRAPERLAQIQERAKNENCDFIIHCGDFCHRPNIEPEFVAQYNDFQIPSYHVLGNHDNDGCAWEDTLKAYRLESGYYFFDRNGFRFVVLDANYFRNDDGSFTHYTKGNYFKYTGRAISNIPPEQVQWLAETLESSPYPCVLFSHQSVEREVAGVANWEEVRNLIDAVNVRHPGRVRMYINGHHHRDFLRILNNVIYFDLNSASFDWVEGTHDLYPKEICEKHSLANHTVIYNDPVHAVITMNSDGLIKIEGMESSMFMDVTRTKAGQPFADTSGRPVFPKVQSAEFCFKYN